MREILSLALIGIGVFFMLVASIGILRMPDIFLRMSASSKASTLGVTSLLVATALHFGELGVTSRALATVIFMLLTAPVAAHILGRAAYFVNVPLWQRTWVDELRGERDTLYRTASISNQALAPADSYDFRGEGS